MNVMMEQMKRFMGAVMRRLPGMITCAELDAFICDYLDDRLSARQLRVFEKHLSMCEACRAYLDEYRHTIELERQLLATPDAPPPGDVPEDLVTAILEARKAG